MKISKKITLIIVGAVILIGAGCFIHNNQMYKLFDKKTSDLFDVKKQSLEEILDNTSTINLEAQIFSLKKHYYILVDDVVVGEVTGKIFPIFGDTLTLTDTKGNVVKTEYQVKRLGPTHNKAFNLSLSRLAEIHDSNGNVDGYIGEEKLNDFFKITHRQYFYDKDMNKIGSAKPDFFMFCKDYKISDINNNVDYIIDGNIFSLSSKSTIKVNDDSEISQEDAIFYNIIENSIIDGATKGSSSSSSKKK